MGSVILESIVGDVKASQYFSVLADEVTDVSGWEQLGVALRFVKDGKAEEKLVSFVACSSVTGESICAEILAVLERLGLDTDLCWGQGYDGAGTMSGHMRGCQARFREVSPHATYFHCSSHQLNLALSKSASVSEVGAMVSNLKALGVFFKYSPKRQRAVEDAVVTINEQRHANNEALIAPTKFKMLCDTRWVERHTAFETFHELYEALLYCLDDIGRNGERNWDAESISKASGLLTACHLIVSIHCGVPEELLLPWFHEVTEHSPPGLQPGPLTGI